MLKYKPMTCCICQRDMLPGDKFDVKNGQSFCRRENCQAAMRAADGQQSGGVKRPVMA